MAGECNVVLLQAQGFTSRNTQLQINQINPGNKLGDRMFHLKPGIHLQKTETAIFGHQKFYRSNAPVLTGSGRIDCRTPHLGSQRLINKR